MTLQVPVTALRRVCASVTGATRTMYGFFRSFSFKRAVRVSSCAELRLRATLVSRQCPADGRKRPWASNNTYGHKNQIIQGYLATPMDARSHVETSARPSHGENRG